MYQTQRKNIIYFLKEFSLADLSPLVFPPVGISELKFK